MKDPIEDETIGAKNQILFLSLSNIWISNSCAVKKAVPEPIAILIEIKSEKFVEKNKVKDNPKMKPKYTIFLALIFPYLLLDRSVIKKVTG